MRRKRLTSFDPAMVLTASDISCAQKVVSMMVALDPQTEIGIRGPKFIEAHKASHDEGLRETMGPLPWSLALQPSLKMELPVCRRQKLGLMPLGILPTHITEKFKLCCKKREREVSAPIIF